MSQQFSKARFVDTSAKGAIYTSLGRSPRNNVKSKTSPVRGAPYSLIWNALSGLGIYHVDTNPGASFRHGGTGMVRAFGAKRQHSL